ncbi:MAG: ribosome small subunit-dependent GTPase A [Bryobacterales bacterium]|nr:ribosome small subunit-dependent GTPase A [Bryobacterales bacterium]
MTPKLCLLVEETPLNFEQLGWNSFFVPAFAPWREQGCAPARVMTQERGAWLVESPVGEILVRHCRGEVSPVTGDWVVLRSDLASIQAVLPRRGSLGRKEAGRRSQEQVLAANVDIAFVVMGLDGDYNPRRLERYLVLCRNSRVAPLVVLNKSDLCEDWDTRIAETRRVAAGADVLLMSALQNEGVERLASAVEPGQTAALLGSSGAGKSTILNRLRGFEAQRTQPVREGDSRGRHTTTQRQLVLLKYGWLLMDLPGLREIQPWGEASGMTDVFPEIAELAGRCRFRDCRHQGEPGCAVVAGIDAGRLESYRKLIREAEFEERRHDLSLQAVQKAKWKKIHKAMRNFEKR